MENKIYFDNAATTLPDVEVVNLYTKIETEFFGNSGSIHKLGIESLNYLNKARESILSTLKLNDYKVYFVASSTEANNIAIKSLNLTYDDCIAVEDSPNGIKSAYSAKLPVIMIPDTVQPSDDIKPLCHNIFTSLEELKTIL